MAILGYEQDWPLQGLEKPIIILSTAVTCPGSFVGDAQRLNVALTRAKHHLILVRASTLLLLAPIWCNIVALSQRSSPAHGKGC